MADSSLDDFFAKKDKGKKKSKSKIKPDDILAEQLGEKPKKKKKPKPTETAETVESEENKKEEEAEEWEEVVEEQETDYSGLRIQTLQVSTKDEEEKEVEDREEGEEGDRDKKDEPTGPWNKVQPDDRPLEPPVRQPVSEPEPVPDLTAGKVQGGKYIPPARRSAQNQDGASPVVVTSSARRKPKVAPNIKSESDFPTLGGANEMDRTPGNWQFEEVRSGGKQIEDPSKKKLDLQLDNKFGALETD